MIYLAACNCCTYVSVRDFKRDHCRGPPHTAHLLLSVSDSLLLLLDGCQLTGQYPPAQINPPRVVKVIAVYYSLILWSTGTLHPPVVILDCGLQHYSNHLQSAGQGSFIFRSTFQSNSMCFTSIILIKNETNKQKRSAEND